MAITIPGTSEPIGSVDYATRAGHADSADNATSAASATYATSAGTASSATNAGHATTADTATNATNATNAANASRADIANSAELATHLNPYNSNFYLKTFNLPSLTTYAGGHTDTPAYSITKSGYIPISVVKVGSGNSFVDVAGFHMRHGFGTVGDDVTDDDWCEDEAYDRYSIILTLHSDGQYTATPSVNILYFKIK